MSSSPEVVDISERIASYFPLGSGGSSIDVVVGGATGEWIRATGPAAVAIIRTLVWDIDPDTKARSLRDLKEQEVHMGWPVFYDDEQRVAAFFAALGVMVDELGRKGSFDELMPSDVMCTDALGLERAKTQADFEVALRAKRRLGKYL